MPLTILESGNMFALSIDEHILRTGGTYKFSDLLHWALGVRDIVRSYAGTDDLDLQLLAAECLDESMKKEFKACAFVCKPSITFCHLITSIGSPHDTRRKVPSERSLRKMLQCCETLALLTKRLDSLVCFLGF